MATVAAAKVIGNGSKECNGCHRVKHYTAFYVRSGYGTSKNPAIMDGHFVTECKACMKVRASKQVRCAPWESTVRSEELAITVLMKQGFWATTGKATQAPDVDVCVGPVWVEVKHAKLDDMRSTPRFSFVATPAQQKRGYLAHVIMLICEYPDGRITYHLFDWDAPFFYFEDMRPKSGYTFTPGKLEASKQGRGNEYQLTQPVMDAAEDDWQLVHDWQKRISEALLHGERPTYGKPFAR